MLNQQPISPVERSSGDALYIHSIFETIQGEGPFAGRRAIFVRLAGCNLRCPACDTEYTKGATRWHIDTIMREICDIAAPNFEHLVVITGGEPFRQNLGILCNDLAASGLHIQIETNGKLPIQDYWLIYTLKNLDKLTIVCSPKTKTINENTALLASAFKYVVHVDSVDPEDGLPTMALGHPAKGGVARPPKEWVGDIYIQPQDDQDENANKENAAAAVRSVMEYPGRRRLCLQMHKIVGLD